jgi:hypothetical protein
LIEEKIFEKKIFIGACPSPPRRSQAGLFATSPLSIPNRACPPKLFQRRRAFRCYPSRKKSIAILRQAQDRLRHQGTKKKCIAPEARRHSKKHSKKTKTPSLRTAFLYLLQFRIQNSKFKIPFLLFHNLFHEISSFLQLDRRENFQS